MKKWPCQSDGSLSLINSIVLTSKKIKKSLFCASKCNSIFLNLQDVNAVTILINNIFVTWCYHFLLIKWCAVQVNKENPILQTEFGSKNYD